jgi:hypothetical protein
VILCGGQSYPFDFLQARSDEIKTSPNTENKVSATLKQCALDLLLSAGEPLSSVPDVQQLQVAERCLQVGIHVMVWFCIASLCLKDTAAFLQAVGAWGLLGEHENAEAVFGKATELIPLLEVCFLRGHLFFRSFERKKKKCKGTSQLLFTGQDFQRRSRELETSDSC